MFFLPDDILKIIIDEIDIISLIMLNATCKGMRQNVPLTSKISDYPIQYVNKVAQISVKYDNFNDMVDDIYRDIYIPSDIVMTTFCKEYNTTRQHHNYTLIIHRNIKYAKSKCTYNYSFSIKKRSTRMQFQFIFDPMQENYIVVKNMGTDVHLPLLFLYIGCKVLFKIHGYCDTKSLSELPSWFSKLLLNKSYNGMILKDIVNGFIVI
jgi:hypothetical protein